MIIIEKFMFISAGLGSNGQHEGIYIHLGDG